MAATRSAVWDAVAAITACSVIGWSGEVWRCHGNRYPGDSADGSLKVSGRYNRGLDKYPEPETWPALYTSIGQHVALGERIRHTTPAVLSKLRGQRISCLYVDLQAVLVGCDAGDCAELGIPGLALVDICHPVDYSATH